MSLTESKTQCLAPCYCGCSQTAEVHTPSGHKDVCVVIKTAKDVVVFASILELFANQSSPVFALSVVLPLSYFHIIAGESFLLFYIGPNSD